jgi:hypothetical protein
VINSNQDQESRGVRGQPGSLLSNLDTPWPAALGMSRILPRVMVTRNNEGGSVSQEEILIRGYVRACEVCGRRFTGVRADARYCSNACRQTAYRQRKGNDHE